MRFTALSFAAVLAFAPPASALPTPETATYAIANPQRPGAKAPDCTTLAETPDGCTFHNEHGITQHAVLPVVAGEYWIATPGDARELRVRTLPADGTALQRIQFTPQVLGNADATLTFDRIRDAGGRRTLVERRRVSVMIHAHE